MRAFGNNIYDITKAGRLISAQQLPLPSFIKCKLNDYWENRAGMN